MEMLPVWPRVNYEVANFSRLEGYDNKGTIHIVTNNQVDSPQTTKMRSSIYCTDLAKVQILYFMLMLTTLKLLPMP